MAGTEEADSAAATQTQAPATPQKKDEGLVAEIERLGKKIEALLEAAVSRGHDGSDPHCPLCQAVAEHKKG